MCRRSNMIIISQTQKSKSCFCDLFVTHKSSPEIVISTHHDHVLLPRLGGVLGGGHRVPLQGHDCLAVTPIRGVFLKLFPESEKSDVSFLSSLVLFYQPEFQLDALDRGLGDHGPVAALLGDGHHRGGGKSRLPQDETHAKGLQEILVLLGGDLGVLSCDRGHGGDAAWMVSGCAVRCCGCSKPEG